MQKKINKENKAILLMVLVTFLWGVSFPIIKKMLTDDIKPFQFLTYRLLIAFILMFLVYKPNRQKRNKQAMVKGLILGVFLFLGLGLQTFGLQYTSSANSSFITMLYVVMVPFMSPIFLKKRIGGMSIISAAIAFLGSLFIVEFKFTDLNKGDLITLICAIAFAFQIVFISKYASGNDSIVLSTYQNLSGFVLCAITMFIFEGFKINFSVSTYLAILFMGVVVSVVAYTLQIKAQEDLSAVKASIICSLEAVFATIISVLFFNEKVSGIGCIGFVLIIAAIVIPQIYDYKKDKTREASTVKDDGVKMKKYKALIFDLDGTLLDSYQGIFNSFSYTYQKLGLNMPFDNVRKYIGPPLYDSFKENEPDDEKVANMMRIYREYYVPHGQYESKLYDGTKEMLIALKNKGYKLFVGTCKPIEISKVILEKQGIYELFDGVYGATDDSANSTKLSVLNKVFANENLDKNETLMIGDSKYDVEGAMQCQIDCAIVTYGFGDVEEMKKNNLLTFIFDSPQDIINKL